MPGESKSAYFLQRDLLERGWTKPLISRLLGSPDEIRHRHGGGEYYLFGTKRVQRGEKRKLWLAETARRAARCEARREAALWREITEEYLREVRDNTGDESDHWSDHPAIAPFLEDARKRKQLELLTRHGLLPALFAVNREAKRQREASQRAYLEGDYESATDHKLNKERLYWLKGQAPEHLWRDGQVERVGWHEFPGGLLAEVLAGGGYRFHRPAATAPAGMQLLRLNQLEAKPVKAGEVPAEEAEEAVRGFLQGRAKVKVYQWPRRERKLAHWRDDNHSDEDDGW